MTSYVNTRDNNTLSGIGFRDGDDLTTANGSRWVFQNEQWYPVVFGGAPAVQTLTVQQNSAQGVVLTGLMRLTQAQYNALAVKDAAVMYVIVG